MQFTFVINPSAGKGRGARLGETIVKQTRAWSDRVHVVYPDQPAAARRLAREHAAAGETCLVAVGGDGTVNQVAAGIIESGGQSCLGVVPAGTGNDFWRMTGLPFRVRESLEALTRAQPVACDYGRVQWTEGRDQCESLFVNAAGIGFDATVAEAVRTMRLPGLVRYTAAAILQLTRWKSPDVEILGDAPMGATHLRLLFAYAGNGSFGGGGFPLVPGASLQDGLLDVCVVEDVPFLRALVLLPRARTGTHGNAPEVKMFRTRTLVVKSETPLPLHVDGEFLSAKASNIRIEIVPFGIRVLMPPSKKI